MKVGILVALSFEALAIARIFRMRQRSGSDPAATGKDHPGIVVPVPSRRRLAAIIAVTAMVAAGALLATPVFREGMPVPLRNALYKAGLTRSPDVEDVEAGVQRLSSELHGSDLNGVRSALRVATARFDALDPVERSAVRGDVELELLRGRQFLERHGRPAL
jgi:hypothetical protein